MRETAQRVQEDQDKLVHPLKKPLLVGELAPSEMAETEISEGKILQTSATSSVTKQMTQQDILKVQQPHMFGVCQTVQISCNFKGLCIAQFFQFCNCQQNGSCCLNVVINFV